MRRAPPGTRAGAPTLSGAWRTRVRWYPGDWVWIALALLCVAGATAAVPIARPGSRTSACVRRRHVRPAGPGQAVAAAGDLDPDAGRAAGTTTTPRAQAGHARAVALRQDRLHGRARRRSRRQQAQRTALQLARKAIRAGLLDVGVLDSGRYTSLHPGYYVVFSGVYESADDAQSALAAAVGGYKRAYTRQIVS